jgi:hypothetical protein
MEVVEFHKCSKCKAKYCEECGDVRHKLCYDCLGWDGESLGEDINEEDAWSFTWDEKQPN